jgi:hypothetical protein
MKKEQIQKESKAFSLSPPMHTNMPHEGKITKLAQDKCQSSRSGRSLT